MNMNKLLAAALVLGGCYGTGGAPGAFEDVSVEPAAVPTANAGPPPGIPTQSCNGFRKYQGATFGPDADGGWVWYNVIAGRVVAAYQRSPPAGSLDAFCYDVTPVGSGANGSFSQGEYPWDYVAFSGVNFFYVTTDGWTWKKAL